jgi:hypothetical protein
VLQVELTRSDSGTTWQAECSILFGGAEPKDTVVGQKMPIDLDALTWGPAGTGLTWGGGTAYLFIVRHGQGVHNAEKEKMLPKGTWAAAAYKLMNRTPLTDAPLTKRGVEDAMHSGRAIAAKLRRLKTTTQLVFGASSLRRSQQTTLCVYRYLRATRFCPEGAQLERAFDKLVLNGMNEWADAGLNPPVTAYDVDGIIRGVGCTCQTG